jgi:hypothetical protein
MTYADHPTAMRLRAMNIIYETTKERGATILIPTSMVDSMNPVVALALVGAGNRISKSERTFAADEPTVVAKSAFILPIATGDRPKSSSQASLSSWLKTSSWQQL